MNEVTHQTAAGPDDVWRALSNGWLYASWVVGASRIRAVEGNWPTVGAKIHHSVGSWPALLDDETEVKKSEPGKLLYLTARTRPLGEAAVELELLATGSGTSIVLRESLVSGVMGMVPKGLQKALLGPRNRESLRRLAFLAEGHAS